MTIDSSGACNECGRVGVALFVRCPGCGTPLAPEERSDDRAFDFYAIADDLRTAAREWRARVIEWNGWWADAYRDQIQEACAQRAHFLDACEHAVQTVTRSESTLERARNAHVQQTVEGMIAEHRRELAADREIPNDPKARRAHWLRTMERDAAKARDAESRLRTLLADPTWSSFAPERAPDPQHPHVRQALATRMWIQERLIDLERARHAREEAEHKAAEHLRGLQTLALQLERDQMGADWSAVHVPQIVDLVRVWRQRTSPQDHEVWQDIRPRWALAARRWRIARDVQADAGMAVRTASRDHHDDADDRRLGEAGLTPLDATHVRRRHDIDPAVVDLAMVLWLEGSACLLVEVPRGVALWTDATISQVFLDVDRLRLFASRDRRIGRFLEPEPYRQVVAASRKRLTGFLRQLAEATTPSATVSASDAGAMAGRRSLSVDQEAAITLVDSGAPVVLVTGPAGTGKSFVLRALRSPTTMVAAPTGVAALNVQGETIHSLVGAGRDFIQRGELGPLTQEKRALLRRMERLVIDEVSMLRSDLLDAVDQRLKEARESTAPFGGVPLVLVGDLFQLPPVVTENDAMVLSHRGYRSAFFFDAQALAPRYRHATQSWCATLRTQHRQAEDARFAAVLDRIRMATHGSADLDLLNSRVIDRHAVSRTATVLCARNHEAAAINDRKLESLPGPLAQFAAWGSWLGNPPAEEVLMARRGARVVLLRNDPDGRFVNGSQGTVVALEARAVRVELDVGGVVEVTPVRWEQQEAFIDPETDEIAYRVVRSFTQIPLRLSWALTIHKSQGMTLQDVAVDVGGGSFAAGQTYVALSRVRRLADLVLLTPLREADVFADPAVAQFMGSPSQSTPPTDLPQRFRRFRRRFLGF